MANFPVLTTNDHYCQDQIKADPQTLAAHALYFSKFVQAWHAEGINLYAIHPQNKIALNHNVYPQCKWTGAKINRLLRDHLLPLLKKDHVQIEVWLGTLVNDNIAGYVDPVRAIRVPVTHSYHLCLREPRQLNAFRIRF